MQRLQTGLKYGLILVCMLGFMWLGDQRQDTAAKPAQDVTLVKRSKNIAHTDQLTTYSPDKTYRDGQMVIKNGQIYEVQVASSAHS
ncbi:hypothetical protein [Levilactobacillus spicheri]|uniref:Surface layer protein A domain-containing protein n=2 Tax=Levilactobacillus spicheri TaxID=216463 RepID=A0ABQ0WP21_9LACO|nr:hypothetical protein [Levilactobacillus spicheri]KRL50659.1 hypothetical protein FD37_GL001782 [Levilactobacillus spicheri DSM 15429]GEO66812.1 hypothetical protein LSP04_12310 [Levilactobacillus spicheri]